MRQNLLIIAITSPSFDTREAIKICELLEKGEADFVHIRKPGSSIEEVESLIRSIPSKYHRKLKLHDHFDLIKRYNLGGVHLNSRNPVAPQNARSVSKSLHSIDEINDAGKYDYFFLSPVFDSISKEGYKAAFDLEELEPVIRGKKAVALGGVTPEKFEQLSKLGFYGAAMLGYYFPD